MTGAATAYRQGTQRGNSRHATLHHLQHVSRHSPAGHANADQLDQVADDGDLVLQGAHSRG